MPGVEFGVGAALNAQRHSLPPYHGYGIGCDGGIAFVFPDAGITIGLLCENISTNYKTTLKYAFNNYKTENKFLQNYCHFCGYTAFFYACDSRISTE